MIALPVKIRLVVRPVADFELHLSGTMTSGRIVLKKASSAIRLKMALPLQASSTMPAPTRVRLQPYPPIGQYHKGRSGGPFCLRSSPYAAQDPRSGRQPRDRSSGAGDTILARTPRPPCGLDRISRNNRTPCLLSEMSDRTPSKIFLAGEEDAPHYECSLSSALPAKCPGGRSAQGENQPSISMRDVARPRYAADVRSSWHGPLFMCRDCGALANCQSKSELRPLPSSCKDTRGGPKRPHRIDKALLQNSLNAYRGATGPTVCKETPQA